ncbi:palmitoyltransferase ZDHHC22 isoform X2 [Hippocampus comes]|uniref:palmitoyltransferase ZDHHC22 isoform X2 n=1 Tax=Hippocampus comes TaxID=109280 RepID=UPI00094F13E5|nr:PREDICTED: palmitoyltransferase ZDHHC22 isoform X2 [Hippocampus comes]
MFTRMLKLRLLNAVAPAYFFMATVVTFVLHFGFFMPTIFPSSDTSPGSSANETAVPVCSPHCSDKVDAHYLLNGRHFCKLCKKVILKRDHHCFFTGNCIGNKNMRYFIMFCIYTSCTCLYSLVLGVAFLTVEYSISFENPLTFLTLLPLSTGYFFTGTISGLQLFLVLMLYVWLGIGLVCAGFCCQQVLLVARGQTWCQMQRRQLAENRSPWRSNLTDVFGSNWALGLILPVHTAQMCSEEPLKQD